MKDKLDEICDEMVGMSIEQAELGLFKDEYYMCSADFAKGLKAAYELGKSEND